MIAWSRRRSLIAGVVLILVVNAIALAGVAFNRSGDPTSILQLSERELRLPYGRWNSKENNGVMLNLVWRVHGGNEEQEAHYGYGSYGGGADWLDKAKLLALGFDLSQDQSDGRLKHWRTKELLLVLELDGAAYRQSLARAQKKADEEEKLSIANPGNKEFEGRAKLAKKAAEHEKRDNSRLFVVDAGFDAQTLRAQYPDQAHYLIVRGQIRPQLVRSDKQDRLTGYISALSISQINVPVEFQQVLKQAAQISNAASFTATVAFGNRLEPWIVALTG
jgi:hypothetical protein